MKGCCLAVASVALSLFAATPTRAQVGMDIFKKPAIAKAFNPQIGKGAEYETTMTASHEQKSRTTTIGIVAKESLDTQEAYWMEFVTKDEKGETVVGKALFTKDDFQFHRMIVQMPGQPAMEMPFSPGASRHGKVQESLNEWLSVGTESITVPAGSFRCEHWRNDKNNADIWTSDAVTPFGMVKQVDAHNTMVLVKVISDFPDRISGPVQQFDPQAFQEQMMRQMQQEQPPKP